MGKWFSRYLILTICLLLVLGPLLMVISEIEVLSEEPYKTIFLIALLGVVVVYYVIMTIMMINGDKNNININK